MTIGAQSASADQTAQEPDDVSVSTLAPVFNPESGAAESVSPSSVNKVLEYWTQERLENAVPMEPATPHDKAPEDAPPPATQDTGPQVTIPPAPPTQEQATPPDAPEQVSNFSRTNGRVFYHNAVTGLDYVCSASALNSDSKTLVATAGHCVHGGPGGTWHQNWIFIPGYHRGERPNGTFVARSMRTMADWINEGENARGFNSDVAFVNTFPNENQANVVNAVGGHGIIWGGNEYEFSTNIFGYPTNEA